MFLRLILDLRLMSAIPVGLEGRGECRSTDTVAVRLIEPAVMCEDELILSGECLGKLVLQLGLRQHRF